MASPVPLSELPTTRPERSLRPPRFLAIGRQGKLLSLNCAISPPLVFAPQKAPTGSQYGSPTPSSAPASDTASSARSPVTAPPCSCSRRSPTAHGGSGPLRRRLACPRAYRGTP